MQPAKQSDQPIPSRCQTCTERSMRVYALFEDELETIGSSSAEASACFALASFFISIVMDVLIQFGGTEDSGLTGVARAMLHKGTWISGVLGLLIFGAGVYFYRKRQSLVKRIKEQTRQVSQ